MPLSPEKELEKLNKEISTRAKKAKELEDLIRARNEKQRVQKLDAENKFLGEILRELLLSIEQQDFNEFTAGLIQLKEPKAKKKKDKKEEQQIQDNLKALIEEIKATRKPTSNT